MKAPDKLYCMHRLSGDYSCSTTPFGGSIEYIRKDALIEWLEKRLHEVGFAGMIHIIDVIDKLNSM